MTPDTSYTLFTDFTDGDGNYVEFEAWADACAAFDAAKANSRTLHAKLKFYFDFEDDFVVAEWSRPSIFNLETT